jgi:tetratricopeptide (TPR) repeat protein
MKKILFVLSILASGFLATKCIAVTESVALSPSEQAIAKARKSITDTPAQYQGYNLLAAAFIRRALETSDPSFYSQADAAVKKSLELAPDNFDTEKIRVSILLGEHDFPAALDAAQTLNKRVPDDVMVYGLLTDANVGLGNYKDAEVAAQWMLNLRPGNLPALTRTAQLRELFGDNEGANELIELALQSTSQTETEERASLLAKMGHLRLASGSADTAGKLLQESLALIPDYPPALGNLAQVRIAQKQFVEAVSLLQRRYQAVPRAENLYDLAEALELAGRNDEAKRALVRFETSSLAESGTRDNSNRKLVFYYADHEHQPVKALEIARQELQWRHDVYTLDSYAWALHVNGQDVEARKQIEAALAVGIQDASLFRHAGEIALKGGDTAAAEGYLKQSAALKTMESEQARVLLSALSHVGQR